MTCTSREFIKTGSGGMLKSSIINYYFDALLPELACLL